MFRREILQELEAWKNDTRRKPLILRGARQVGKTTVVHEFGQSFDNYLYFNLEKLEHRQLFETDAPLADLIRFLFAQSGKARRDGTTLIFIDEIQNSPKTISLLRYFYEEHPELHVIAAGSLLENVVDVKFTFPVGRVQYLPVRPCSFREFVGALGQGSLLDVMYDEKFSGSIHARLLSLFSQYVIVGGMPEAVQAYAERGDVLSLDSIYETLLQAYRDDVEKYVNGQKLTETVRFILERGWLKAGETVTLGGFAGSEYKAKEVSEAFRLLQKAMLMELVYPTTTAEAPILTEVKRQPKLIWLDTGLVNYAAGVRGDVIRSTDLLDVWRGRVAEHAVAQELLTQNHKISQRRAFWVRGKGGESAEVDFLWSMGTMIIPIEVKAGHNAHLRSLHSFIDHSTAHVAVRVWSGTFSVEEAVTTFGKKPFRLINLPFYMVGRLENIVNKYL